MASLAAGIHRLGYACRRSGSGLSLLRSAGGSSPRHFYSASVEECEWLKTSADWVYEGIAFDVPLPDAQGNCAFGTVPLYRGFRMRHHVRRGTDWFPDGPQHRFAPAPAPAPAGERGVGPPWAQEGIAFCIPASFEVAQARLAALSGDWEFEIAEGDRTRWGLPNGPLRMSFGPTAPTSSFADRSSALLLAGYTAPLSARWGDLPVVGGANWRPLDNKVVVWMYNASPFSDNWSFHLAGRSYELQLHLEYAGLDSVHGYAFSCSFVCPGRLFPLVGRRR